MSEHPFRTTLDDLDWLWKNWWVGQPDSLSSGDLRRASTTLDLLLIGGMLGRAWRHYGFDRQPRIMGPDVRSFAAQHGYRLDLAIGVIAGGGRQKGIDLAFIGAFRVDNPETGAPAEAEVGFAVETTCSARQVSLSSLEQPVDPSVERAWYLSEYLESVGAVRMGTVITRREVIQYFRNYAGAAHHHLLGGTKPGKVSQHELAAQIDRAVHADIRDGLHFELLSIGQAVARSTDLRALAERIRNDL